MAAPIGNKNALRWSLEAARDLAQKAYDTVSEDCYFISDVADRCDIYRELFFYLLERYNDDEIVFNTIKRMQNKCEKIVAKKTAEGKIIPSLGIFILKSYHGLSETSKQEIKHEGNGLTITFAKKQEEGLNYILGESDEETIAGN